MVFFIYLIYNKLFNWDRHITEIYGGWRLGDINNFSAKNKKDLNGSVDYYKVVFQVDLK